jgi:hypothetical protein
VAEGAQGLSFVEHLAALTGADVAASSDLTGAAEQGGDWVLESSLGNIQTVALHPDAYSAVLTNTAPTLSTSLSFATKVDISAGTSAPNSVTSADIDGDTKPDRNRLDPPHHFGHATRAADANDGAGFPLRRSAMTFAR